MWYLKFSVTDLYGRFVAKNIGISGKYSKIGRWEFLGFLTTPLWETKAKAVGYPERSLVGFFFFFLQDARPSCKRRPGDAIQCGRRRQAAAAPKASRSEGNIHLRLLVISLGESTGRQNEKKQNTRRKLSSSSSLVASPFVSSSSFILHKRRVEEEQEVENHLLISTRIQQMYDDTSAQRF